MKGRILIGILISPQTTLSLRNVTRGADGGRRDSPADGGVKVTERKFWWNSTWRHDGSEAGNLRSARLVRHRVLGF